MNLVKAALVGPTTTTTARASVSVSLFVPTCCFHSTTVLEQKRRTQWHYRFNYYAKKRRNKDSKRTIPWDKTNYAEHLFQSWLDEEERCGSSKASWYRGHRWVRGANRMGFHPNEFNSGDYRSKVLRGFLTSSDDEDDEPETVFRNPFGGIRFTYWSSYSKHFGRKKTSSRASSQSSRHWSCDTDESETEDAEKSSEAASARRALGLSPSGPLKLEDVKSAYRASALRWHPDRHGGSSKVKAEEKFKHCSAAYKTLCDSLATA